MNTPEHVKPSSSGLPVGTNPDLDLHPPSDDSIDIVGSDIGKYHVVRKLGQGGMGAVFEAVHTEIGQRAAIKVLHPHLTQQPKFVKRFVDEARLISMVGHPGLVKIYDFTKTSTGAQCIVMEFLVGESLFSRFSSIKEKAKSQGSSASMPLTEALQITRQVASALAAVHARGIIHRDLKPENIMLVQDPDTATGERAKILDFGIARLDEPDAGERHTTSGVSLGTPTYMAPEQIEGLVNPTDRIDVYALGVILFELLSGEPPFQSTTTGGILRQHLIKEPPPLPQQVPADVQALVRAALEKEPTARPSMAQLVERIDLMVGSSRGSSSALPILSTFSQEAPVTAKPGRLRAVYFGAAGIVALALVVMLMLLLRKPTVPAAGPGAGPEVAPEVVPPTAKTVPKTVPPTAENPPAVTSPAGRPEPPNSTPKKTTPKGEGKPRGSKGLRFGDLPRTPKK